MSEKKSEDYLSGHPELNSLPWNAPCQDCHEVLEKRTINSRYFISNTQGRNEFYQQKSYTPIHYKNSDGYWITIDKRLRKKGPHFYRVDHPYVPVEIDMEMQQCRIINEQHTLIYNNKLELFLEDQEEKKISLGIADWSDFSAGDGGIYIRNCWDGIDMEMQVVNGGIKTNFILNKKPEIQFENLLIRDNFHHSGQTEKNAGGLLIKDFSGSDIFSVGGVYAYENNGEGNPLEFNYRIEKNVTDIEIPGEWILNPNNSWPLIIDPLVSASNTKLFSTMLYSGYNAICYTGYCSYFMDVPVPPKATITDVTFLYAYLARSPCAKDFGGFRIYSGNCVSPAPPPATGGTWRCRDGLPGLCYAVAPGISIFNEVNSCLPPAQCTPYNMPFEFQFSRCINPNTDCSFSCINSNSDWVINITGRTLELSLKQPSPLPPITQTICEGNQATIGLEGEFGVPPYTYQWTPGGSTTSSISVSPLSSTIYTGIATDNCGNTVNKVFSVNVTLKSNPGFSIAPNPACTDAQVKITGSGTASATSYDWLLPGYSIPSINNTQNITVQYPSAGKYDVTLNYSSGNCIFPLTQQLEILPLALQPAVTISPIPGISICSGDSILFNANTSNAGNNPTYQWTLNNNPIGFNTPSFKPASISDGDLIKVRVTANQPCISNPSAESEPLKIAVLPLKIPSISISVSPQGPVCKGTLLNFTLQSNNSGTNPRYVWKVNGNEVSGQNGTSFSTNSLDNGDIVTAEMLSNEQCPGPDPKAKSNSISLTIYDISKPGISITTDKTFPVCEGTMVTFSTQTTDGGSNPSFQWIINGTDIPGETSDTFKSSALKDNDFVSVRMKTSKPCSNPDEVTSAPLKISILPKLSGDVKITMDQTIPFCEGTPISFQATYSNVGNNPSFQWKVNGIPQGGNSSGFSPVNPATNDSIGLSVNPDGQCFTAESFNSNVIKLTILPNLTPSISISVSPSDTLCPLLYPLQFKATSVNVGKNPTYQWLINSVPNGTNSTIFSPANLRADDSVKVIVKSDYQCSTKPDAVSSGIKILGIPPVKVNLGNDLQICLGESVSLKLNITGGKSPYAVKWSNGENSDNSIQVQPQQNSMYSVQVNDQCFTDATTDSVNVIVNPLPDATFSYAPKEIILSLNPDVSFSGKNAANINYQWDFGDGSQSSEINPSYQFKKTGTYTVQLVVKNSLGCKNSSTETIIVKDLFLHYIPNTFTPNDDGKNDRFELFFNSPVPYTMEIFNRWGEMIYSGDENSPFWDGRNKSGNGFVEEGIYVYKLSYKSLDKNKNSSQLVRGIITVMTKN